MDQPGTRALSGAGKCADTRAIDPQRQRGFRLRLVDGGIGGGIEDQLGRNFGNQRLNRVGIAKINFGEIARDQGGVSWLGGL